MNFSLFRHAFPVSPLLPYPHTLEANDPNLYIFPSLVIAFDAHVLQWNLDNNPPEEYARHYIKEASFYNTDIWSVDLVLKLNPNSSNNGGVLVNFMGLQEKGMWPAKKAVKTQGGIAMELFEKLDQWIDEKTSGTVDTLLLGCIAGAVVV